MTAMFLPLILISSLSSAAIVETELSMMCRLSKNVRTLRVEKLDNGTCRTVYTKAGVDQNIGNAQNQDSCAEILYKVRDVLVSADWKCREVKESRVSNIIEVR
jgi:hypothetical protein